MPRDKRWFFGLIVLVILYIYAVDKFNNWRYRRKDENQVRELNLVEMKDESNVKENTGSKENESIISKKGSSDMNISKDRNRVSGATSGESQSITNTRIFKVKPLVIWSSDYHIGPIQDLKHLLTPLGVKFIDKSLSGGCHAMKTCGYNLRVLNQYVGMNLPPPLIPRFYREYKDDPEMKTVDAFVCFHPASLCELFMPFGKSIIVIASTRYEAGRHSPSRWSSWNRNLIKISQDPKNVVAANNLYDVKYIEYFTDIDTQLLPSYCGYINQSYNATRQEFLLAEIKSKKFQGVFLQEFQDARVKTKSSVRLVPLRQKYSHYNYSDLTAHQGIVYVPYQVSLMSIFEQYRMNIPLFFPSLDLLTEWQYEYHVISERTYMQVYGQILSESPFPGVRMGVPDPNNELSKEAIRYWIQYSDFYQLPHIILYDSVLDLVQKMQKVDLRLVSERMRDHNQKFKENLVKKWIPILKNIYEQSKNHKKKYYE